MITGKKSKNKSNSHVYYMHWDVGAHTGFSKEMLPTIAKAIQYGMRSCQFFMGNPKSYSRTKITSTDIESSNKLLERFPMNIFTHFPYIANLNGTKGVLAWSGDNSQDSKTRYMIKELEYELSIVSKLNAEKSGVVIHPGCYTDRNIGLRTIAKTINMIEFNGKAKLLLENCAGEGSKLCKDFKEIAMVLNNLDESKRKNVGVCVDTAHIWGQGDYNLSNCMEVDRMFRDFDTHIGLENFTLLHLNDSKVELGSKKDRHACLGTGYIWGKDFKSLIHLLNICKKHNIPSVLETHGLDMLIIADIQPK